MHLKEKQGNLTDIKYAMSLFKQYNKVVNNYHTFKKFRIFYKLNIKL